MDNTTTHGTGELVRDIAKNTKMLFPKAFVLEEVRTPQDQTTWISRNDSPVFSGVVNCDPLLC